MPRAVYQFPRGFLWGTATAAHQVEGRNTNNNWYAWEQQEGRIRNGDRSGLACDWWGGRWKEDLDRAVETGQNAHRLSIEWSRIQPTPDHWDEDALDHYREILQGMMDRGLTPMVTLHHFTDPLWLMELGGWENPDVVGLFDRFVARSVDALQAYANLWVTINEPNVYYHAGYVAGGFPPGKHNLQSAVLVAQHMIRAHAAAYHTIHKIQPTARVGFALHYRRFLARRTWSPLDRAVRWMADAFMNRMFLDTLLTGRMNVFGRFTRIPEARNTQDFIGLNYYTTSLTAFDLRAAGNAFLRESYPREALLSETGFLANVPEGFFHALNWLRKIGKPIIVTENGVEDPSDRMRPQYLVEHIHQLWRAVNAAWQIKGYFHWSLVDNFEWERGWSQRFGLWGLDPATQKRFRRTSVDLYAAICHENALSWDTVHQYAPQVLSRLFPE
ncbi:MAG TPA: glycoside hydrolase family 1 protein [Anaerolineaceae bacterium]|nr:glycoside hydrolase family 1 protein [Anaerolineaceae bacterium]HQO97783.1 glycoside hydrolase family 1 protein [Anaerolineaceae bacterium]HQP60778.1 glycoside hydrolase family 1 protein [Anaerolineaceae bacterium]